MGSIYQVCRKCKMDVHEKFVLVQASVKNELEKFQVNRWQTYFKPIENFTFPPQKPLNRCKKQKTLIHLHIPYCMQSRLEKINEI